MKICTVYLDNYRRFTDLTIKDIPATAKLVVLVGPNGCGKTSLFDAFKTWYLNQAFSESLNDYYCKKDITDKRTSRELVCLGFRTSFQEFTPENYRRTFYFRTAYRNSPEITVSELHSIQSPLEDFDMRSMIQNDATVNENYQRLVSATLSEFFDVKNNNELVSSLREKMFNKLREPLHRLFPDLYLKELGLVTKQANFYFEKGITKKYGYENLSSGEKAAFDLLLDFVLKLQFFNDTVFCIDEPETHIHTSLQAKLLSELFALVPDNSQLWIATHSFGMMKEAKRLSETHPGEVVFLNFDGYNFDEPVTITPSTCDSILWNKILEITLDDFAPFVAPEIVVFCEGTTTGGRRSDFDARCYSAIFGITHSNTFFYSLGGCEDITRKGERVSNLIKGISPNTKTIKIIDRDDRSKENIDDLKLQGINVLSRRNIESFLLDDEVLKKWCISVGKPEKESELLAIKQQALKDSIGRNNPPDDLKSASNDICAKCKNALGVTGCGNNGEMIMRDTLAKLITPDMAVYQELEKDIFYNKEP